MRCVGLALSGGTARSVAHVGVLKALVEAGIPIDCVAGTSGGSIVAVLLAAGRSITELETLARSMSWSKLASIKLSRLGFVSSKRIESLIESLLGDRPFSDLEIPCAVTATDLMTGEKQTYTTGSIALAVRASCSIPQIFLPVEIDGKYYVDGGLSEYMPVQTLADLGATFRIGVHLSGERDQFDRPSNLLQLIMQLTNLIALQNLRVSVNHADFIINPPLGEFSAFDFGPTDEMMEIGYQTARTRIPDLQRALARHERWWYRFAAPLLRHSALRPA